MILDKTRYICLEGLEGTGKGTQLELLKNHLVSKGYSVIVTKEPGTDRVALTQELRGITLNNKYDHLVNGLPREFLFQSIRGIHLNSDVYHQIGKVDFIIQDRGILSGLAYGAAQKFDHNFMLELNNQVVREQGHKLGFNSIFDLYSPIIYFKVKDHELYLKRAMSAKKEFAEGDAMEAKGGDFMGEVKERFDYYLSLFQEKNPESAKIIIVEDDNNNRLTPDEVLAKVLEALEI